jgi:phage conserved hypothetical protein, C-terminal domain
MFLRTCADILGLESNPSESLSEDLQNPSRSLQQEQEQEQEQDIMLGKPNIPSLNSELKTQAKEVLAFLNERIGKQFRFVDTNLQLIEARLKSGATVQDCKSVIAKKRRDWIGDEKMAPYLRPATLFNKTKFEQYLGELGREAAS